MVIERLNTSATIWTQSEVVTVTFAQYGHRASSN